MTALVPSLALWQQPDWPLLALERALADLLVARQPPADAGDTGPMGLLAALVAHRYGQGHTCVDLAALADEGPAHLGWPLAAAWPWPPGGPQRLQALAGRMPWVQGPASPLVLEGPRLYLRRNWVAERHCREQIAARLSPDAPQAPDAAAPGDHAEAAPALRALLDGLFPPEAHAFAPEPDWQRTACAVASRHRFTVITGGPGTGKTTTVVRLLALLQRQALQAGRPALQVALAAPTGKAAARLGEAIAGALQQLPTGWAGAGAIPTQAVTLHRLLRIHPDAPAQPSPPVAADVVVVDEASMVDLDTLARLLQAVPASARLVLLGDQDQLASVEAGAVLAQLCQAGPPLSHQTVVLRHSRRFGADSAIGRWARAVNAGDPGGVQALWAAGEGGAPLAPGRPAQLAPLLREGWAEGLAALQPLVHRPVADDAEALALLRAWARFQVLCAVREGPWGVHALNRVAAQALGLPPDPAPGAGAWYGGRPVMVTRNDPHLGLMNGDVGLCLPHPQGLRVAFASGAGGVRWVPPARLDAVETVFAMTVHKSQGSEFDHVALVLPAQDSPVLSRELVYTGITRARARLTLALPEPGLLATAVARRVQRSGGLAERGPPAC